MRKNFRFNIIIRILVLTLLLALLIYFLLVAEKYLRSVYMGVFLIIAIIEFVWYVDRSNRDFAAFLLALLQNDFTTTFSESNKGRSFNELHSVYNRITQKFKSISSEKEVQHIYLEALVEHVRVGILSYDENEKVHLMNHALKKLLHKPQLLHLQSLENIDHVLLETIRNIKPGENRLVKLTIDNHLLQLSLHASEFRLQSKYYKLVSFQNIKNELDANEMDAWQKLIRVLTHEIMNSVTPISSLTETLHQIVENESKNEVFDRSTLTKVLQGLDAIKSRSSGLQSFTQAYRNLTKIPPPKFRKIKVSQLIDRVTTLLKPDLQKIFFTVEYSNPDVYAIADPELLDQVLINLIKNALEALEDVEDPHLSIRVVEEGRLKIMISDNGTGIDEDKLEQIFVPFFTTKKNGSGIGLALSKQIMRLHNGTLNVESIYGSDTTFTMEL